MTPRVFVSSSELLVVLERQRTLSSTGTLTSTIYSLLLLTTFFVFPPLPCVYMEETSVLLVVSRLCRALIGCLACPSFTLGR